jgi:hypothetical protein
LAYIPFHKMSYGMFHTLNTYLTRTTNMTLVTNWENSITKCNHMCRCRQHVLDIGHTFNIQYEVSVLNSCILFIHIVSICQRMQ